MACPRTFASRSAFSRGWWTRKHPMASSAGNPGPSRWGSTRRRLRCGRSRDERRSSRSLSIVTAPWSLGRAWSCQLTPTGRRRSKERWWTLGTEGGVLAQPSRQPASSRLETKGARRASEQAVMTGTSGCRRSTRSWVLCPSSLKSFFTRTTERVGGQPPPTGRPSRSERIAASTRNPPDRRESHSATQGRTREVLWRGERCR